MLKKITQKELAFYKLYTEFKKDQARFINTWEFVGEIECFVTGKWEMMSYKCPTRLTDLFQENPDLLERKWVKGKSGTEFYCYKLAKNKIDDPKLLEFYKRLKTIENYLSNKN